MLSGGEIWTAVASARPAPEIVSVPEDVGKSTVLKLCGECHAVEQAISIRASEKDWRDTVDLMIERGANGTPEEFRTVIDYLSKHFSPK